VHAAVTGRARGLAFAVLGAVLLGAVLLAPGSARRLRDELCCRRSS
jgi:hypothetical protein